MNGAVIPCSAAQEATWAWWCWTAIRRSAGNRARAYFVERYSGWRSWATTSGSSARRRARWARPSVKARCVGEVLEVAVVGRHVRPPAARERERVLELGSHREDRARRGDGERQRLRRVTACPPDQRLAPGDHPGDRVVVAGPDLAVVGEECVREAGETGRGVRVVGRQRLVGQVAGGEHERPADRLQEQVVERRVRQEDPEPVVARRHGRCEGRFAAAAGHEEHDRPRGPHEERGLGRRHVAERPGGSEVADHDRERLGPAALPVAQAADRRGVGGVAGEVVAPQALDRDDPPRPEVRHGGRQGRLVACARRGSIRPAIGQPRPAAGAGHGLRVEAAVRRVRVLGGAVGAQRERPHRRPGAVVRQLLDDRRARPAVRAVRERVAVAPVGRVGELRADSRRRSRCPGGRAGPRPRR